VGSPRPLWAFAFNVNKRATKGLIDVVGEFCRHLAEGVPRLEFSIAYLTFLNRISNLQRLAMPDRTQFMLLRTDHDGHRKDETVLYVSPFHDL